jgi:radical SAM protein with 4Fe4S-binding SPASM domain
MHLDTQTLKGFLKDIAERGIKGVMFAGEGEPLLHKDISGLITCAKDSGLDVAVTTNGVLLSKSLLNKILVYLSWLRISLNAGTSRTYAFIHRTTQKDFDRVIINTKEAVRIKKRNGYPCTIGVQFLLLNENYKEAAILARALKDTGADYLIIKPYSQHPRSLNRLSLKLNYEKFLPLEGELKKYEDANFKVIFRKKTMLRIEGRRPYKKCLGLPFWAYLSSGGDLYACSAFLGDGRFCYGNIYRSSFQEIWQGQKRKEVIEMMEDSWDIENCRRACRMDEINAYLWELKDPPPHVNFI